MIEIKDITNYLLISCPKCKTGQLISKWGKQSCGYIGCDNELDIQFDLETATQLLENVKRDKALVKPRVYRGFSLPTLQRFPNGDTIAISA
jgi:hypothetical protein